MPLVYQKGRIKFYIYRENSGRHHLPHVHIRFAGAEAVFELAQGKCLKSTGFGNQDLKQLGAIVNDKIEIFLEIWSDLNEEE